MKQPKLIPFIDRLSNNILELLLPINDILRLLVVECDGFNMVAVFSEGAFCLSAGATRGREGICTGVAFQVETDFLVDLVHDALTG